MSNFAKTKAIIRIIYTKISPHQKNLDKKMKELMPLPVNQSLVICYLAHLKGSKKNYFTIHPLKPLTNW